MLIWAGFGAASASANTCASYANQAAAQRAHDTVDADHDGIYCESLPCPCSSAKGGGGGTGGGTTHATPKRPKLGRPHALGPWTKHTNCHARGTLPDARCTPGSVYPKATRSVICRSGYSQAVRNVPESVKNGVYAAYGISSHSPGRYEVDHLVPLEAGGSNSTANLFPQRASPHPGFHEKDQLENAVHARVCDGRLHLGDAQRRIARDWTRLYVDLGL